MGEVLFGALLGALTSLAITHLYYTKGKGLEKLSRNLWLSISNLMIQQNYPEFFSSRAGVKKGKLDSGDDKGTPYIKELRYIKNNNQMSVLIRVVDTEWDHPVDSISIILSGNPVSQQYLGFGYSKFMLTQEGSKSLPLQFKLTDLKKNEKTQIFTIA